MKETIERLAREKHTEYLQGKHDSVIHAMHSFAIAILTDPNVGFKEALEWVNNNGDTGWAESVCACYNNDDNEPHGPCTCICHTAEAKLAELKELEKRI